MLFGFGLQIHYLGSWYLGTTTIWLGIWVVRGIWGVKLGSRKKFSGLNPINMKIGKAWKHTGMCNQRYDMFFYHDVIEKI